MDATQNSNTLLHYWLQGLWRNYLNNGPLNAKILTHFASVRAQEVAEGHFSTSLSSLPQSGRVWIAPKIFQKVGGEEWAPLWLPAVLDHTMLFIDTASHRLPWIPASQFEKGSFNLFSESLHQFDEWLRFDCWNEDQVFTWQEWQDFYQATEQFLENLSEGRWRQVLENKGFNPTDKALIIHEQKLACLHTNLSAKLSSQLTKNVFSSILEQYSKIEECESQPILEEAQLKEKASLFCGSFTKARTLTPSENQSLVHALSLEPGYFTAIKTAVGSFKTRFIKTLVACLMVQEALAKKTSLEIFLLSPHRCGALLYDLGFEKSQNKINKSLQELYQDFIANLSNSDDKGCEDKTANSEIQALQAQDESAEKAFSALMTQQHSENIKDQNRSVWTFFTRLFLRKQINLKRLKSRKDLTDKIRQIKVQRTKIHQQLVNAVERDFSGNQCDYPHQLFLAAKSYWESLSTIERQENAVCYPDTILLKLTIGENLVFTPVNEMSENAILIVDEANRFTPQQIAPLLSYAAKAIFLGDTEDLPPKTIFSAFQEERDMNFFQLVDEEVIEQLHYKGQLQSTGNAFTVALKNNYWQELTDYGTSDSVFELNNEKPVSYEFISVEGKSEKVGNELCNLIEAQAVVELLNNNLITKSNDVMIVTPFLAQKRVIIEFLEKVNLTCSVFILDELPSAEYEHVIFSPVYTTMDLRPFIFDQGDYYFYSILSRTKKSFWVVGQQDVFDPKMHSPSGNLAKRVLSFKKKDLASEPITSLI